MRNHVAGGASLAEIRHGPASRMQLGDFAERMLDLANDAAAAREFAAKTSNARLMLLAVREEAQVLGTLMTRLGIDETELLEALREAKSLVAALNMVLDDEPLVTAALSRHLTDANEPDLARAFHDMSERASARHLAHMAQPRRMEIAQ